MKKQTKSYRCIDCKKEFDLQEECQKHVNEVGHHSFALKRTKLRLNIG